MKKSTSKIKMTVDDLAIITARQFDRVDEKINALDIKIDTEINALRTEMKIGFANADKKLELKTGELDQKISKIDNKIDTVIEKIDSFLVFIAKDHEPRIQTLEKQVLELQTA